MSLCVISDKQEQQCRQLMAGLDKIVSDLDKQEKAIYTRVRPPLEQNRPLQDSADRLQDMKVWPPLNYFVFHIPKSLNLAQRENIHSIQ